jgi:hypothetical protein
LDHPIETLAGAAAKAGGAAGVGMAMEDWTQGSWSRLNTWSYAKDKSDHYQRN